ncbi:hypothetical protein OSB04_023004 [Centaurea solstitialis]|uniref:Large ribosomal subunit protein uL2 C-terminal domain-containing protein n=1 Tax=Centaurea solstitialis TaxID=347529 RepID=A0AA38T1U7_9ASTR|nr:hypothetical protein OSB04_023004 [Centaurea solstitialis]
MTLVNLYSPALSSPSRTKYQTDICPLPTSTDMPLGTAIHNIEITLGKGGQLARAAGAVAKLIAKEGKSATLKLPFGDIAQLVELRSCNWVVAITGWMSNCPANI